MLFVMHSKIRIWASSDQSMHEKTTVANLIEELYTFLKQADARELGGLFRQQVTR